MAIQVQEENESELNRLKTVVYDLQTALHEDKEAVSHPLACRKKNISFERQSTFIPHTAS